MNKKIGVLLVVALFSLTTVSLFSQPRMRAGKALFAQLGMNLVRVLRAKQKELNITDEQLQKIDDLVVTYEKKIIDLRSELSKHRLEMRQLFQNQDEVDLNQLQKALEVASQLKNEMVLQRFQLRQEINSVLTEEQRAALKDMINKFRQERRAKFFRNRQNRWPRQGRGMRNLPPRQGIRR